MAAYYSVNKAVGGGFEWPLAALHRWPFIPVKIYRKNHRGELKVAADREWPLISGGR